MGPRLVADEAHRSQTNLDQKITITDNGVRRSYGFAKYLHDSLPNATYVGFTGTPVDATLDVFGPVVDSYTMTEAERPVVGSRDPAGFTIVDVAAWGSLAHMISAGEILGQHAKGFF